MSVRACSVMHNFIMALGDSDSDSDGVFDLSNYCSYQPNKHVNKNKVGLHKDKHI